jgi:hypothetical protein
MSVKALTWAFEAKVDDCRAKLILLALADHADDNGHCWPSIERLAAKSDSGRRSVTDKMNLLKDKGLIGRIPRTEEGRPTYYVLNLNNLPPQDLAKEVSDLAQILRGGQIETAPRAQSALPPRKQLRGARANSCATPAQLSARQNRQPTINEPSLKPSEVAASDFFDSGRLAEDSQRQVLTEHDFCSDDGTVVITAEEFRELERRHPDVKNMRGLVRQACRSWLLTHDAEDRKRRLVEWIGAKQPKTLKPRPDKQTSEERAQDRSEHLRASRDREDEVRQAKAVREELLAKRAERLARQAQGVP